MSDWIPVCVTSDIDENDLIRWDHDDGRSFAIYNTEKGFFATDGMCTHEYEYLEEGLVVGMVIECRCMAAASISPRARRSRPRSAKTSSPIPLRLKTGRCTFNSDAVPRTVRELPRVAMDRVAARKAVIRLHLFCRTRFLLAGMGVSTETAARPIDWMSLEGAIANRSE